MKSIALSLLAFIACTFLAAAKEETARLLASKNILNQLLVESKDMTVEYYIYNVGER